MSICNLKDGWLSPYGEWVQSRYWGHGITADEILQERYPDSFERVGGDYGECTSELEKLGWIRFTTITHKWIIEPFHKVTTAQKDKAFELTKQFI